MDLVYAVLFLSLATLIYNFTLLACRNPEPSRWAGDFVVGNLIAPGLTALIAVGAGKLIQFGWTIRSQSLGYENIGLALAIAAATLICYKLMRVKKTLAIYADNVVSIEATNTIAAHQQAKNKSQEEPPEPPPQTGTRRRAA